MTEPFTLIALTNAALALLTHYCMATAKPTWMTLTSFGFQILTLGILVKMTFSP
jgi:hypothetical protein